MQSPEPSRTRTRFLSALGRLSARSKSLTGEEGSADGHHSTLTTRNGARSAGSHTSSLNIREGSSFSESTIPQKFPTTQRRAQPRSISLSRIKRPGRLRSDSTTHIHQHYVRRAHHVEDDQAPQTNFINPFLAGPVLDLPMRYELTVSPTNDTPQTMPEASPHLGRRRRATSTGLRLPKMMLHKTRTTQTSSSSGGSCDHSQPTSSPRLSPAIDEAINNPDSVAFPTYITKLPYTRGLGIQSPAVGRGLEPKMFPFPDASELCDHVQEPLGDGESLFDAQDLISNSSQRGANSSSTTSTNTLESSTISDVCLHHTTPDQYSEVTASACIFHAYSDNTPLSYISAGRCLPSNRGPGIRLWETLAIHAEMCDYHQTISDDEESVLDADDFISRISTADQ
ncbi:hypothetical protein DFH28DRAFT_598751 [Melampsora americana]|nr:hypothetical protein DFH28DRAFT_598751 [Melampsora americana]